MIAPATRRGLLGDQEDDSRHKQRCRDQGHPGQCFLVSIIRDLHAHPHSLAELPGRTQAVPQLPQDTLDELALQLGVARVLKPSSDACSSLYSAKRGSLPMRASRNGPKNLSACEHLNLRPGSPEGPGSRCRNRRPPGSWRRRPEARWPAAGSPRRRRAPRVVRRNPEKLPGSVTSRNRAVSEETRKVCGIPRGP